MNRVVEEDQKSVKFTDCAEERRQSEHRKRIVVVSIAVTLEKIRHLTGPKLVTELITCLHNENFDADMVRTMIRSADDCRLMTEEVINDSMARASWSEK